MHRREAVRRFTFKPVHDVGAGLVPARFRLLAQPGKRDAGGGVPYGNNVRWYTSEPTGDRKGRPYGINVNSYRRGQRPRRPVFRFPHRGGYQPPADTATSRFVSLRGAQRRGNPFLFYLAAGSTDCHSQCAHWLRNDTGQGSIAGFLPIRAKRKAFRPSFSVHRFLSPPFYSHCVHL